MRIIAAPFGVVQEGSDSPPGRRRHSSSFPYFPGVYSHKGSGAMQSLRVDAAKLDDLVNLVGELVIAQARLTQLASVLGHPSLTGVAEEIERLSNELRDNTLGIRMAAYRPYSGGRPAMAAKATPWGRTMTAPVSPAQRSARTVRRLTSGHQVRKGRTRGANRRKRSSRVGGRGRSQARTDVSGFGSGMSAQDTYRAPGVKERLAKIARVLILNAESLAQFCQGRLSCSGP